MLRSILVPLDGTTFSERSLPLATSLATAAWMAPVAAPAGAQALEEVIVTAQRREESLQDIPMSVSAFTGDAIEIRQIEDIADLQFSVPNLLADADLVPEILQEDAVPEKLGPAVYEQLANPSAANELQDRFATLGEQLRQDANERGADGVVRLLQS